jgi:hypothetical protein
MKSIVKSLLLVALIFGAQAAWSEVDSARNWMPSTQPFPADADASISPPPRSTYADRYPDRSATTNPFPVNTIPFVTGD